MRRVDRLFQIIEIIRSRKMTTAEYLAQRLELSTRTIHRHINDLRLAGIPITGSAGKGFTVASSFSLPPISLSDEEMDALAFGARLVESSTDEDLAQAARQAFAKIEAISSNRNRRSVNPPQLFSGKPWLSKKDSKVLGSLRRAVDNSRYVDIDYVDLRKDTSSRRIRPLGLVFWGRSWTVVSWCELRQGFRVFRLDRIQKLQVLLSAYPKDPKKSWDAFLAQLRLDVE